jgi:HK97 family phage prohead protease
MFVKSWNENKSDINFYFNHDDEQAPGLVQDVYEDDNFAYTKAKLGTHTLGNDVLIMMDEGVIKKASFGYAVVKSNNINLNGKKIRELKEVKHIETSVLTKLPANPKAGVRQVNKSLYDLSEIKSLSDSELSILKQIIAGDQNTLLQLVQLSATLDSDSDLYTWICWNLSRRSEMMGEIRAQIRYNTKELKELSSHVRTMENFCHNTKASDDTIKTILEEIESTKQFISDYNTADTQEPGRPLFEPVASIGEKKLVDVFELFNKSLIK